MKLGRVTGSVTATAKEAALGGQTLLVTDIVDASMTIVESGIVAVDRCGAGPGDLVLITTGSAARMPAGLATVPVDATIIAIVDDVKVRSS